MVLLVHKYGCYNQFYGVYPSLSIALIIRLQFYRPVYEDICKVDGKTAFCVFFFFFFLDNFDLGFLSVWRVLNEE